MSKRFAIIGILLLFLLSIGSGMMLSLKGCDRSLSSLVLDCEEENTEDTEIKTLFSFAEPASGNKPQISGSGRKEYSDASAGILSLFHFIPETPPPNFY